MKPGVLIFGTASYALFMSVFVYFAGFLTEYFVPKAINDGRVIHWLDALLINVLLIALFGFFHSLMARDWVKSYLHRIIPASAERSLFVLQSSAFLALAMWLWQPMPGTIWTLEGWGIWFAHAAFLLGITIVLVSTFLIDHFELFGLRQVWVGSQGQPFEPPTFTTPYLYRYVRHPMQLGMIIAIFSTPHMTIGHMLFAGSMTIYIAIGLHFEERALIRQFGDKYLAYRTQVPMLFPRFLAKRTNKEPLAGG